MLSPAQQSNEAQRPPAGDLRELRLPAALPASPPRESAQPLQQRQRPRLRHLSSVAARLSACPRTRFYIMPRLSTCTTALLQGAPKPSPLESVKMVGASSSANSPFTKPRLAELPFQPLRQPRPAPARCPPGRQRPRYLQCAKALPRPPATPTPLKSPRHCGLYAATVTSTSSATTRPNPSSKTKSMKKEIPHPEEGA